MKKLTPSEIIENIIYCVKNGIENKLYSNQYDKQELGQYLSKMRTSNPKDKLEYCRYILATRIIKSKRIRVKEEELEIKSWYLFIVLLGEPIEELMKIIGNKEIDTCIQSIKKMLGPLRANILDSALSYNEEIPLDRKNFIIINLYTLSKSKEEYKNSIKLLQQDLNDKTISYEESERIIGWFQKISKKIIEPKPNDELEIIINFFEQMDDNDLTIYLNQNSSPEELNMLRKIANKKIPLTDAANQQIQRINRIKKQINEKNTQDKIKKIKRLYEIMIANGFWIITDFANTYYKNLEYISPNSLSSFISAYNKYLTKNELEKYKQQLEKNRMKEFKRYEPQLKEIAEGKINDIIDYYLKIGMPILRLKKLYKDLISPEDQTIISTFISGYFYENGNPKFLEYERMANKQENDVYCGIEITPEIEQITLLFLKTYGIPNNFFGPAVLKLHNEPELKKIFEQHYLLQLNNTTTDSKLSQGASRR